MPSGYNYSIAPLILNPSMVGIPQKVVTGNLYSGDMVISNEAPYVLSVLTTSNSAATTVLPQTSSDPIPLGPGDEVIYVTPTLYLPGAAPSSQVGFQFFPYGAPQGISAYALARQTAPISAGGKGGYSFPFSDVPGGSGIAAYYLFNPSTNKVNALIYRASYSAAGSSTNPVNPSLQTFAGSTGISGTTQVPTPHVTGGPASVMRITVNNADTGTVLGRAAPIDQAQNNGTSGFEKQFLLNEDEVIVTPGNGAAIFSNQLSGIVLYTMNMGWLEQ